MKVRIYNRYADATEWTGPADRDLDEEHPVSRLMRMNGGNIDTVTVKHNDKYEVQFTKQEG